MIDVGSRVQSRITSEGGHVVRRTFNIWARDWFYDVEWDNGEFTRVPFLSLTEATCAGCKRCSKSAV